MATRQELKEKACAAIEERKEEIIAIAQDILHHPETGYTEQRTSGIVKDWFGRLDVPYRDRIAITGVKGQMPGGAGAGPTVGLVAEMDSLRVEDHPFADPTTGAAHACGHNVQIASMIGSLIGLRTPGVMESLAGRLVPFAVPATLIEREIDRRLEDFARRLMDQRIDPRQANIDWNAFREGQRAPATEAVGSAMALDEIARRENVTVSDADLDAELQRYADQTGHSLASIRARLQKDGELGRLAAGLRREKAVSLVISRARITKS